jgi:predicted methyltransferase
MFKKLTPYLYLLILLSCSALAGGPSSEKLAAVLAEQSEEIQARYVYRHPEETIKFFSITPGMTVVEALPGGGWYTKILLPYIGQDGSLNGADYSLDMYPLFGFFGEDFLKEKETWVADFTADAKGWSGDDGASVTAFVFGSMPEEMKGTADAVLFIRAMHNLARFEGEGGFLTAALRDAYDILKPGGTVGVVQHQAREGMSDEWAGGQNGYLKKSFVIEKMQNAGFEFVAGSDINVNGKDQPTEDDMVWRLPPSLATSKDNPELKVEMEAIGESNRMTLKFRKPQE